MPTGTTLANLRTQLRDETSRSNTVGSGANEDGKLNQILRRTQRMYYDDYEWPHLDVLRTITLVRNKRFYPFPSDMDWEAATQLYVKDGGDYAPLTRGIDVTQYSAYDSLYGVAASFTVTVTGGTLSAGVNKISSITVNSVEVLGAAVDHTGNNTTTATAIAAQINSFSSSPNYLATSSGAVVTVSSLIEAGIGANALVVVATDAGDMATTADAATSGGRDAEQSTPVTHWDLKEDDETDSPAIEVFPVPSQADTLILTGKRSPGALSADTDTAVLDDILIVLTAASELLAREDKKDADAKASAAQRRFLQLKKRAQSGTGTVNMAGLNPVRLGARVRIAKG